MKCSVCDKELNISNDGGIAIMMAVCYKNCTSLLNNSYCKEYYEKFVKDNLIGLSNVVGMEMPELMEEEQK